MIRRGPLRARATVVLALVLVGGGGGLAAAAAPAAAVVSAVPDSVAEVNGNVNAIVVTPDRTYIGGTFTRAGQTVGTAADLGQSDGVPNLAFARPNFSVSAVVSDGAGGWFLGGDFTRVGTLTRNHLAHVLADGSVDPAFDPNLDDDVAALVRVGSTLYAAGGFTTVNGSVTRRGLAAFDTTTGAATGFAPDVPSLQVFAIAVAGSTLYAGGNFTSVNGGVNRNRLAGFDTTTGAVTSFDPNLSAPPAALAISGSTLVAGGNFTFVNGATQRNRLAAFDLATGTARSFNPNVDANVTSLAISGTTVYAGGSFQTVNGGLARNRLAAFNLADGVAGAAFDPDVDGTVRSLAVSGGTLFVGGDFGHIGATITRANVAAVSTADGAVVPGFDPAPDNVVSTIAVAGTRVYIGGGFSFMGPGSVRNGLAAILPDGTLDPAFAPAANSDVAALAFANGRLYAGGAFTTVNGGVARNRVAAFDAVTGAFDPAFDPNVDSIVQALAVSGTTLYVGGQFTTVNGATPRNRLAAFDTTTGAATSFDPNMSAAVKTLLLSGSTLYAGGSFQTVNGATPRNYLAALSTATGVADPAFNPNIGGEVFALALSQSTLYVGGTFFVVNGSTPRTRIAALDRTTGIATSFRADTEQVVRALALSGSTLYIGGDFTTVGYTSTAIVGGREVYLGGTTRHALAALDATTGAVEPTFDPNLVGVVSALTMSGPRLLAGGSFNSVGPRTRLRVAQFSPAGAAPAAATAAASAVTTTGAGLAGAVNPGGLATTYVFEYGQSLSFGSISPPAGAGAGSTDAPVGATLTGLTANTTYYYRLVASNSAGTAFGAVLSFRTGGPALAPVAGTGPVSSVTNGSAVLNGVVNPSGRPTVFTFEYGPSTSFGTITTVVALDDAGTDEPVSATLSGLSPDTTYFYRLVASSSGGTTVATVAQFSTGPGRAPVVTTGSASAVAATSATLAGTVDPHGSDTTFTFEYGTTNTFGSISSIDRAGDSDGVQPITLPLGGLSPNTTYRYRIVATSARGTTAGAVMSFTTASPT